MFSEVALESAAHWLIRTMLLGTVWLLAVAAVLQFTREPARRARLLGWSMAGAVVISLSGWLPTTSSWSLPTLNSLSRPATSTVAPSGRDSIPSTAIVATPTDATADEDDLAYDDSVDAVAGFPAFPSITTPSEVGSTEQTASKPSRIVPIVMISGLALYGIGLIAAAAWFLAGIIGLWRVVKTAQSADDRLSSLWNTVRPLELTQTRLLISSRTTQPIAFQFRRSYVVLPESWRDHPTEQIEWALLHEAEHILRRDFPIWQVANLARIVFWCHPLLWWMRRELRVTQDFLADAAAARRTETRIDYAEFLTASVREGVGRSPLVGLGLLGRRSDLYRRVAMLLTREKSLESRSPRWWTWSVVGGVAVVLGGLATMRVGADGTERGGGFAAPASVALAEAPVVPSFGSSGFNPFSAETFHGIPSPLAQAPQVGAASGTPADPTEDVVSPVTKTGEVVQKLKVTPGEMIEIEPGVHIAIQNVYNPLNAVTWSPDGGAADEIAGSGDPMEGGSESPSGYGGGSGFGGPPQMYGAPGGMPGGFAGSGMTVPQPADSRLRGVTVLASRPNPAAIQVSVDGVQSQTAQTTYKPKFKVIQVPGYWPEEQMVASVAVRFASRTVAWELVSSKGEGEVFKHPSGQMMATLGRWTEGADLRTEATLTLDGPIGGRYVLEAEAIDVEGTAHRGKVQLHGAEGGMMGAMTGGYGSGGLGGMMMGPGGGYLGAGLGGAPGPMGGASGSMGGTMPQAPTGSVVFPHLPPSRISKIRLTWHPYGWVIFRNVSLEPGEKSNLTAELFLDKSEPTLQPPSEEPTGTGPGGGPAATGEAPGIPGTFSPPSGGGGGPAGGAARVLPPMSN